VALRIEEGPLFGYASAALSAEAATREIRNTSRIQRDQGHLQLWPGTGHSLNLEWGHSRGGMFFLPPVLHGLTEDHGICRTDRKVPPPIRCAEVRLSRSFY